MSDGGKEVVMNILTDRQYFSWILNNSTLKYLLGKLSSIYVSKNYIFYAY